MTLQHVKDPSQACLINAVHAYTCQGEVMSQNGNGLHILA